LETTQYSWSTQKDQTQPRVKYLLLVRMTIFLNRLESLSMLLRIKYKLSKSIVWYSETPNLCF
jgi:hypothetical protein